MTACLASDNTAVYSTKAGMSVSLPGHVWGLQEILVSAIRRGHPVTALRGIELISRSSIKTTRSIEFTRPDHTSPSDTAGQVDLGFSSCPSVQQLLGPGEAWEAEVRRDHPVKGRMAVAVVLLPLPSRLRCSGWSVRKYGYSWSFALFDVSVFGMLLAWLVRSRLRDF